MIQLDNKNTKLCRVCNGLVLVVNEILMLVKENCSYLFVNSASNRQAKSCSSSSWIVECWLLFQYIYNAAVCATRYYDLSIFKVLVRERNLNVEIWFANRK